MEYKILQPKKRSVLLNKGVSLSGKYTTISELQSVKNGLQRGMMHAIQNRFDPKTKVVFY